MADSEQVDPVEALGRHEYHPSTLTGGPGCAVCGHPADDPCHAPSPFVAEEPPALSWLDFAEESLCGAISNVESRQAEALVESHGLVTGEFTWLGERRTEMMVALAKLRDRAWLLRSGDEEPF